jgi:hypothetical protein
VTTLMQGPIEGNRGRRWLAALLPPALAGLLAVLLLATLWTVSLADLPGAETPIFTRSLEDGLPDIAASPGGAYLAVAWSRGRDSTTGPAGYFNLDIASEAEGKWRMPVTVYPQSASASNMAREARIAFDSRPAFSSTLHMVWNQKTASGFSKILYAHCNVAASANCTAAAITQPVTVRDAANVSQPDVAVDEDGLVHVVWTEGTQVRYSCSQNGGQAWGTPLLVRSGAVTVTQPSLAHASGSVHIAWAEGGAGGVFDTIGYRNGSHSSGVCPISLSPSTLSFDKGDAQAAKDPKVAAAGSTVYLVWDVKGLNSIGNVITHYLVYNRSTNGGLNWDRDGTAPEYLDIPTATATTFTQRSVFNNRTDYNYDYGTWLHPDVTLQITGSQTIAHVVWQESTVDWGRNEGTFNIFYTAGNGSSWAAPTTVTDGTPDEDIYSVMPTVAVGQNGRLHIAYMKEKYTAQQTPEDWDIYYFGLLKGPPQGGVYLPIITKAWR